MLDVGVSFVNFGLNKNILRAIFDLGYVKPFIIQERCIPYLLNGCDLLGLAQTGSGKTAAFILPLLHNINSISLFPQILILVPTRELAIQMKDVCATFSRYIQGINIVSLYGGQCYNVQFRSLKKGAQIIIGTPGRLLDHLRRKTLCLSKLRSLVIDEADEMLRMGFIEDVRSIILQVPKDRQTIFFSATLPKEIRRIALHFMNDPKEIYINQDGILSSSIKQNYWIVSGFDKNEALIRFLEIESFDAAIVFVRTKGATLEISSMLENYGYSSAALNGDMNQIMREKTLERLRSGELDILIATDVASRGLDVDRITLVINYDIPMDFESYIHRIGRTGRAGRNGRSLLFIKNSEYRFLKYIERNKDLKISKIKVPSSELLSKCRLDKFSDKVKQELMTSLDLDRYRFLLSKIKPTKDIDMEDLAAILLKMAQGGRSLVLSSEVKKSGKSHVNHDVVTYHNKFKLRNFRYRSDRLRINENVVRKNNMYLYRIDVGRNDGIDVNHIIKVITHEGGVHNRYIGHVKLFAFHSIIELSKCIPNHIFAHFTNIQILNKPINIKFLGSTSSFRKVINNYK